MHNDMKYMLIIIHLLFEKAIVNLTKNIIKKNKILLYIVN